MHPPTIIRSTYTFTHYIPISKLLISIAALCFEGVLMLMVRESEIDTWLSSWVIFHFVNIFGRHFWRHYAWNLLYFSPLACDGRRCTCSGPSVCWCCYISSSLSIYYYTTLYVYNANVNGCLGDLIMKAENARLSWHSTTSSWDISGPHQHKELVYLYCRPKIKQFLLCHQRYQIWIVKLR